MKKVITIILTIVMILLAGLIAAKAQCASTAGQTVSPNMQNGMAGTNAAAAFTGNATQQ